MSVSHIEAEHFDASGVRKDATEIERSPISSFAASRPNDQSQEMPPSVTLQLPAQAAVRSPSQSCDAAV
jgi:hypothetical protein